MRTLAFAAVAAAALVPAPHAGAQGIVYLQDLFAIDGTATVSAPGIIPPTGARTWSFSGNATMPTGAKLVCSFGGSSWEDVGTGRGAGFSGICGGYAISNCLFTRAGLTIELACVSPQSFEATLHLSPANVLPSTTFSATGAGAAAVTPLS